MSTTHGTLQPPIASTKSSSISPRGAALIGIGLVVMAAVIAFAVTPAPANEAAGHAATAGGDLTDGWYRALTSGLGETTTASTLGNELVDGWAAVLIPPRPEIRDGWEAVLVQPRPDVRDGWDHRYFDEHE